jgi:5-formyltetrahydrofolate cyclo-ligase
MNKKELRLLYKEKRNELSLAQKKEKEQNIYAQVFDFDFKGAKNVHVFLPIQRQIEINTYPIVDFLRDQGQNVIVSKSDFKSATLRHFYLESDTIVKLNVYGIPEPENAKEASVEVIDLVFVPLLISDMDGFRVGYGKGFYDRFLSDCRNDIITIGLNFFAPIDRIDDRNEFDIPLQYVFYPK